MVPAGARVLDAERRRPGLPREQRQVPELVRGLAPAAGRDRTRQPGRRDVRLPHGVSRRSTKRPSYVADNNYGRIIAVHLKPVGSGYVATSWENFIWPKSLYGATPRMPHNVTDMIVARDGTFYYVIGNRRTQSYLMKATYVGGLPTAPVEYRNADGAADRAIRRSLEQFHWTRNDPKAIAAAWPHLGSEDRFLRFAARVALETVPAEAWKARALGERTPQPR